MRLGIRLATDPRSGGGHIARASSLAGALDCEVVFFTDPGGCAWLAQVKSVVELCEESAVDRADTALERLQSGDVNGLVCDSYTLGETAVKRAADLSFTAIFRDVSAYGAETVSIDVNPLAAPSLTAITGPAFVPLDAKFRLARARAALSICARVPPFGVLVAFGTRDSANCTGLVLKALRHLGGTVAITVVLGPEAPHLRSVAKTIQKWDGARLIVGHDAMDELYTAADLALGAPGISQFERACCGLPTVLVCQNERQSDLAARWARAGAALVSSGDPKDIAAEVGQLLDEAKDLAGIRQVCLAMVDGNGAKRLSEELCVRAAA